MAQKVEKYLALRHELEGIEFCGALSTIIGLLGLAEEIWSYLPRGGSISGEAVDIIIQAKESYHKVQEDLEKARCLMITMITDSMKERAKPSETKDGTVARR